MLFNRTAGRGTSANYSPGLKKEAYIRRNMRKARPIEAHWLRIWS